MTKWHVMLALANKWVERREKLLELNGVYQSTGLEVQSVVLEY